MYIIGKVSNKLHKTPEKQTALLSLKVRSDFPLQDSVANVFQRLFMPCLFVVKFRQKRSADFVEIHCTVNDLIIVFRFLLSSLS